ncbi:4-hydroxybutyryl-CoA dehydratase/vinylacetyl-CoA-Delta-isomerase [archaeon HR04]|nr:4-hydroxybutyryl-CoA dehydratase/vinylacetyl-CoA-Delta-isomerase [archaeon HR04]
MPLKTQEEFIASLRDGRNVYYNGERVTDVTTHPVLSIFVNHWSLIYKAKHDPKVKDIFVKRLDEYGEASAYFNIPRNADDLLARAKLIEATTAYCNGQFNIAQAIGTDALFALMSICSEVDKRYGTRYYQNVLRFYDRCVREDLAMAVAQTDVKGDRSKRPHEQDDPDAYVHIVERRSDGIVVRGAKVHTTGTQAVNEIIVLPTRNMLAEDRDYAVAFAIPANDKNVKIISRAQASKELGEFDYPMSVKATAQETLTVFDDVFVPNERIFLAGEYEYAGALARLFALWHRFTAISYKPPIGDQLLGAAALIAEYNGISKYPHVRSKIVKLIRYVETIRACIRAAAVEHKVYPVGIAVPNPVYVYIGKYHLADNFHDAAKTVQDLAGGLVITQPTTRDLENPETAKYIEKYLKTRHDVPAKNRLKVLNYIRDLTASTYTGGYNYVLSVHGEGSLEAQIISTYTEYDVDRCVRYVKSLLNIE